MAESPRWLAAILFYLLYAVGIWFFAVEPAIQNADPGEAARRGAFLGLLAYGTYDLTNMATLKNWPLILTVVDMVWGAVMTAAVAGAATFVALQVG
jgi:uncharacterized membrane protein